MIFFILCETQGAKFEMFCFIAYPLFSGVILDNLKRTRHANIHVAAPPLTKDVLRKALIPFIGYFSLPSVSIALSNMILIRGKISPSR
jgi:hypothetical protein